MQYHSSVEARLDQGRCNLVKSASRQAARQNVPEPTTVMSPSGRDSCYYVGLNFDPNQA